MSGGYFIGPPVRRRRRRRRGALILLAIAALAAGAIGVIASSRDGVERRGAAVSSLTVDSRLLHRRLEQRVAVPAGGSKGRPLLLLLHARGARPGVSFSDEFFAELDRLGARAPVVVEVNGGKASYYHDRRDGRWGTYVTREVIPAVLRRYGADGSRIAIGGRSMGGFGALDIARRDPGRFCAVGGHSAAIYLTARAAPDEAFDSPRDFARHDIYGAVRGHDPVLTRERIWIDVGTDDEFRPANAKFVRTLRRRGIDVTWHLFAGGHTQDYFRAHVARYLRWYADELERCGKQRAG